MTGKTKAIWAGVGFAAVVLGLIIYASIGLTQYSCEVCIEFNGRQQCRTAAGSTREEAQRTAADNACAFLSSGMTESMRCTQTKPLKVECKP